MGTMVFVVSECGLTTTRGRESLRLGGCAIGRMCIIEGCYQYLQSHGKYEAW